MLGFFHILTSEIFLQYALIGGLCASISCGIVGSFVVVRRIEYIAGGIAHTVLAGMGLAYFFAKDPIVGALLTSLLSAFIIGWVSLKHKKYEQTIISVLWAVGMAIGVIFIAKTPGYNADLMNYLFGNILMITQQNIYLLVVLDILLMIFLMFFFKQLVATAFDEEFARLRGVSVNVYFMLLLCMIAMTVVSLMQVVGLILTIALLTIPAAIARQYARSVACMMVIATLLGCLFTIAGLSISYHANLPSGATIILFAGIMFCLSTIGKKIFRKKITQ